MIPEFHLWKHRSPILRTVNSPDVSGRYHGWNCLAMVRAARFQWEMRSDWSKIIAVSAMAAMLLSCTNGSAPERKTLDCSERKPGKTEEEGAAAARRDVAAGIYQIARYDLPALKTGDWHEYYELLVRFGMDPLGKSEHFSSVSPYHDSIAFCDGYNGVMDRALTKKYGAAYRKERLKLLPPPGAKRAEYP